MTEYQERTDRTMRFLVVDDNDLDAERIERSLKKTGLVLPIERARDGLEALDALRTDADGASGGSEQRTIMLLDLNMPRMTGLEMLEEIERDDGIELPATFVITTSSRPQDICEVYRYPICGYVLKPIDEAGLRRVFAMSDEYWNRGGRVPIARRRA